MAELPEFLTAEQNDGPIRDRMLARIPARFDTAQGSFYWDVLAAGAVELALAAQWLQEALRRTFVQTTFGAYLDLRAEEHGLTRRPAVPALGWVRFTRQTGFVGDIIIPAGTRVSTASTRTTPAVTFFTLADTTLPANRNSVDVLVQAIQFGQSGNVGAGTIVFLLDPVTGIGSITNIDPTVGGVDEEDDETFRARYLDFVRNPGTSGNRADYVHWAMEVPGVGAAVCIPVRYGPGTVSVCIVDANRQPPHQRLIDEVQDYIAPVWSHLYEAETQQTFGPTSIETALIDDSADSVRLHYETGKLAGIVMENIHQTLERPGIWYARARVRVGGAVSGKLLRIGVVAHNLQAMSWDMLDGFGWQWNTFEGQFADWNALESYGGYAKTDAQGNGEAVRDWTSEALVDELGGEDRFDWVGISFYWDGRTPLDLWLTRLDGDTAADLFVDQLQLRSAFSADIRDGKAPVGAAVTVEAGVTKPITVTANLLYKPGFDPATVRLQAKQNLQAYLDSLVFAPDNDVRFSQVAHTLLNTQGVNDYQQLFVNGGTGNVDVELYEFAVLESLTLNGQPV